MMLSRMRRFGADAGALAFPLGGVGTGNVSLGARGELRDWEIFNRPGKGVDLPNTFFAIWARAGDQEPVAQGAGGALGRAACALAWLPPGDGGGVAAPG